MMVRFILPDKTTRTSEDFPIEEEHVDKFFSLLGNGTEDPELYWNAEIEQDEGIVNITWLIDPVNPQKIVDILSDMFGIKVPDYLTWEIGKLED